jgi:diguanylate cyclase (GGDEF)-like protein
METRLYFQMLRRGWWIIVLSTLTALAAALAASFLATPQYTAIARFTVSPSNALVSRSDVLNGLDTLRNQYIMTTYAEIMNSDRIYNDTMAFLNLRPAEMKAYLYQASEVSTSSVLELKVTGPDPAMAAKIANAVGYETIGFSNGLNQVFTVAFLDTASPPVTPTSPNPLLNAGFGLALGLIVGIILAIVSEQLRIPLEGFRQRLRLDNLTGVYNSRYFSSLVEDELAKNPQPRLSLGIIELNGIRDIFETLPVTALQKIFQEVTETLRRELRGNDVIGRWDDVSFSVLLPNTPGAAALRIFERIDQALSRPVNLVQLDLTVNLDSCIGGAECREGMTAPELFESARNALEQARRKDENRVFVLGNDKVGVKGARGLSAA